MNFYTKMIEPCNNPESCTDQPTGHAPLNSDHWTQKFVNNSKNKRSQVKHQVEIWYCEQHSGIKYSQPWMGVLSPNLPFSNSLEAVMCTFTNVHHFGNPDYEITDPCPEENGAKSGPNDNQNLSKCHSHQEPFKEATREKVMSL